MQGTCVKLFQVSLSLDYKGQERDAKYFSLSYLGLHRQTFFRVGTFSIARPYLLNSANNVRLDQNVQPSTEFFSFHVRVKTKRKG